MESEPKFSKSHSAGVLQWGDLPQKGFLVIPSVLPPRAFSELCVFLAKGKGKSLAFVAFEGDHLDPKVESEASEEAEVIRVSPDSAEEKIKELTKEGAAVVFLPNQSIQRVGGNISTPHESLTLLLQSGVPVVPLYVMLARDQRLTADTGAGEPEVYLAFADVLENGKLSLPYLQEAMLAGGEAVFSRKPFLKGHLARALLSGIKRYGSKVSLIDGLDGSELRYDKLLAAALALVPVIKAETSKKRVGIILPPGKGGILANLAVALAGKVPVNINFTASHDAVKSAIRQADLDKFITADPFVRKMSNFPWPPNRDLILLERVMINLKPKIVWNLILSKLLPAGTLANMLGLPKDGGDDEATIIFTSGSSGDPKGVPLTHRNILANCTQFGTRLDLKRGEDKGLGCLPLFHSFGYTVTLWYPLLEGIPFVYYPSPMEAPKLAELIQEHRCTLMLSTATFIRGFFRRVKREQLATIKYAVVGAEKLPVKVAETFHDKFGKDVLEGYGLTETSPVSNFNLPELSPINDQTNVVPSRRLGAVGHPVSGLAIRIANTETGEYQSVDKAGIVCMKGANVFDGYFENPSKSKEVIKGGWFHTGDIGRIDEDGFLHIEGRLSRFSKIGGEMVPHETLEATIVKVLGLEAEAERKVAVAAIPDDKKGEAIVLLSSVCGETLAQEVIDLRYKLIDKGIPSLWTPKHLIPVEEIPVLASGKLDIKSCQRKAYESLGLEMGD